MARNRDFREFAFLATGGKTQIKPLRMMDLIDNLNGELRRLDAITELISTADQCTFDAEALPGMAELLDDISRRMHLALESCHAEVRRKG